MKRNIVLLLLAFVTIVPLTAANQKEWAKIQKEYQSFSKKPGYVVYDVKVLIIHPLIKEADRKKEYSMESKVSWKGNQGSQTVLKTEAKKGKFPLPAIGREDIFIYPPTALNAIFQSKDIKFIGNSADKTVEGKACRIFKIQGIPVGGTKELYGFVNIDKTSGEIVSIEFGAPVGGINVGDGESEEMSYYFFTKNGGKRILSRVSLVETSKSNGIPFITRTDSLYSKFK